MLFVVPADQICAVNAAIFQLSIPYICYVTYLLGQDSYDKSARTVHIHEFSIAWKSVGDGAKAIGIPSQDVSRLATARGQEAIC